MEGAPLSTRNRAGVDAGGHRERKGMGRGGEEEIEKNDIIVLLLL